MPDFDFDGHNTLYATHGLHPFAAKCPPQLVRYALQHYSCAGETVLDPMMGSGTTLVEARLAARNAIGYDIDPLAQLIARVKSQVLSDVDIQAAYDAVVQRARDDLRVIKSGAIPLQFRDRLALPDFQNRDYWFSPEVSTNLALLSYHISEVDTGPEVRAFLWVAFSSLILAKKSVASARDIIHSRHHHYQHSTPPDVMGKFTARVTKMRRQMAEFSKCCEGKPDVCAEAQLGDARDLPLEAESIDLVFTSPPYGTALDYARAHFLAVAWMEKALGITLPEYKASAPDYIGSERGSLSGDPTTDDAPNGFNLARSIVSSLSVESMRHARLMHRYFSDMYQALSEVTRVLKRGRHAVVVVCPSHVRKVEVPTHEVFCEMAPTIGLSLEAKHTRTINSRLRLLPYMPKAFGNRMSTEFVLVYRKNQ